LMTIFVVFERKNSMKTIKTEILKRIIYSYRSFTNIETKIVFSY
jgi:hypothetical protein